MLFTTPVHRFFFLFGTAFTLCSLPYSIYTVSVGLFVISINWLLEGGWNEKINHFRSNRSLWVFVLIYLSSIISFFYSDNLKYALIELRTWLPLLILPVVYATSKPLTRNELKYILILFCTSVFIASLISLVIFITRFSTGSSNVRSISPYIPHIRLALMVNMSIFTLLYLSLKKGYFKPIIIKVVMLLGSIWLILFLFILQSLTGIVIFVAIITGICYYYSFTLKDVVLRFSGIVAVTLTLLLGVSFIAHSVDRFFTRNHIEFNELPVKTVNGNDYLHDTLTRQFENGNLVWINICKSELEREWSSKGKLPLMGNDKSGQELYQTLLRYMTSKGLSKDSLGMTRLDSTDIALIERGVASVIYREYRFGVYPRLYNLLWEIDVYRTSNAITGNPAIQRLVFFKASWKIIKEHILFGVGLGDGKDRLKEYYKVYVKNLDPGHYCSSHNQYLTVWLTSGLVGLLLFITGLVYPLFSEKRFRFFLPVVTLAIILLSMLNEDTFDTHIGVSFATLFYSIFFFAHDFSKEQQDG